MIRHAASYHRVLGFGLGFFWGWWVKFCPSAFGVALFFGQEAQDARIRLLAERDREREGDRERAREREREREEKKRDKDKTQNTKKRRKDRQRERERERERCVYMLYAPAFTYVVLFG